MFIKIDIKRELEGIHIYWCRCNERLKTKTEGSKRLAYTGLRRGRGHLKIETSQPVKFVISRAEHGRLSRHGDQTVTVLMH